MNWNKERPLLGKTASNLGYTMSFKSLLVFHLIFFLVMCAGAVYQYGLEGILLAIGFYVFCAPFLIVATKKRK